MATTFVNYHVRSTDAAAVARVAEDVIISRAFVSRAVNGWVTVCDETSQAMDPIEIDRLAMEFSRSLETALFTFLIPDAEVFVYHLFMNGDLIDEYNSTPDVFGEITDEARDRLAGRAPVVLGHCEEGTALSAVQSVLVQDQAGGGDGFGSFAFAHDRAHRLASLLGIDPDHAIFSFEELKMNPAASEQYAKIETRRFHRPLRRPIPPRLPPRQG